MKMQNGIFLGSKQAGLEACRLLIDRLPAGYLAAIICPDDRADIRSETTSFKLLAEKHELPFHVVKDIPETITAIKTYAPSFALVHGWYQLIPVTEFPDTLFIGFHYSPLPKYRGNAPLVWQIINGEERLGVSLFRLTAGMDDGELIEQNFFTLSREECIADALRKASELTQSMLNNFINNFLSGKIKLISQSSTPPSYCGIRLPEDGKIDWSKSAAEIHDFVRAQSKPYPGAFAYLPDGRKITIWRTAEDERIFYGVPGSLVERAKNHVIIVCGTGAIKLIEVEVEGEADNNPNAFLKSVRIRLT